MAIAVAFNQQEPAFDPRASGEHVRVDVCAPDEFERRGVRAKSLGVHPEKLGTAETISTVSAAPGRLRSAQRRHYRKGAALMFCELLRVSNVTSVEAAASLDMAVQRVAEMKSGARPVAWEHILMLVSREPRTRPVFARMALEIVEAEK